MNFPAVWLWFVYILPPYILELAVGEWIFCRRLQRKPWFPLRLAAGVSVIVGVLWLAACGIVWIFSSTLLVTVIYLGLFFLTVAVMKMCFEESFVTLLFYGIAAYAVQNLAYRVYSLLEIYGTVWRLSSRIGWWPAYLLMMWGTFAAVLVVAYLCFIRRMVGLDIAHLGGGKIYIISAVTLTITVYLSTWTNASAWESNTLTTIAYMFSCCCCAFILALQAGMLQAEGLKQDITVVRQLWEQDRKQYELAKESIDIINVKCHDLRFRLQSLRTSEQEVSREELEEIENAIAIYDSKITTGCEPLDTILTEESLLCSRSGIRFTCMVDGSKLSFIAPGDIYSLFGNIISNAVEAVRKVEDKDYRVITLEVKQVGNMLLVAIENYFTGKLTIREGALVSDKKDKVNHGYGMKSIEMLARKYGGDVSVDAHNGVFALKLLFPIGQRAWVA